MIYYALPDVSAENGATTFIRLAYDLWKTVLKSCYDVLKTNPLNFGSGKTSLLSKLLDGPVESIITGVATGLLILVFVVGVLREGGHIISEKSQPYGVISLLIRFFICSALVGGGYLFIARTIFDIFTTAINGLNIGSNDGYGLSNPNTEEILGIASGQEKKGLIQGLIDYINPLNGIKLGIIEVLGLVYLLIVVVCAFIVLFKVYGRFFKVIVAVALAPIGFALYASPMTEQQAKKFLFYLIKLAAEGLIIALILILYTKFLSFGKNITQEFVKAIVQTPGGDQMLKSYVAYMISQIFFCILLVSLISASEKLADELL